MLVRHVTTAWLWYNISTKEAYEFKGIEHDDVVHVTLGDLLDAYNKVHGTNL